MNPERWRRLEEALTEKIKGERLHHTYRVLETARHLGRKYGARANQVDEAALMHDYAKALPGPVLLAEARRLDLVTDPAEEAQPHLLHGAVAAGLLRESGLIGDPVVLDAIQYHTTGRAGMHLLEKVIWVADYIEPGRHFQGVQEVRRQAERDLDRALLSALEMTISYVLKMHWPLHLGTVHARNWLLPTVCGKK